MKIGVVDLFCGVGGLTYGLKQAGLDVVAGFDVDDSCEYAYSYNNNAQFINKNIEEVTGKEILELLDSYDVKVLAGCAPCQPFSRHQKDKKDRSKHKDWKLLYQFGRLVREVEPDIVSMENVPELKKEKVFNDFVDELTRMSYIVNYDVFDATDYGVPQRRQRLLLLAAKKGKIEFLKPTTEKPVTVGEIIRDLPPIESGEQSKCDRLHMCSDLSEKNIERIKHSKPGGTWRDWPEELRLECHKKKTGQTYSSVYGRMSWDEVSPTITTQFVAYGTGRFGHPEQNRALSLREGALLQSFPIDYAFVDDKKELKFRETARHIGNAVPPKLGEMVGRSIINSQK